MIFAVRHEFVPGVLGRRGGGRSDRGRPTAKGWRWRRWGRASGQGPRREGLAADGQLREGSGGGQGERQERAAVQVQIEEPQEEEEEESESEQRQVKAQEEVEVKV